MKWHILCHSDVYGEDKFVSIPILLDPANERSRHLGDSLGIKTDSLNN